MPEHGLTEEERAALLAIARGSLVAATSRTRYHLPEDLPTGLRERRGAFVTCRVAATRELRGCIGLVEATAPLAEAVAEMAEAASTRDPRFASITPREAPEIRLEISVLSPPAPIRPEDVVVGRHGLIAERGGARGLLLPQVPVEQGWDRTTFLGHTCLKARLPREAWQEPSTRLLGFTAEVFGEE
jgi:AmmeMemoRadiSam system protein A